MYVHYSLTHTLATFTTHTDVVFGFCDVVVLFLTHLLYGLRTTSL